MKPKTDPLTKPYYRCLTCPNFRKTCGGRPTRDMDLKNWCEYIRDVMDHFHLTIASVAEKADVSQKRVELIRAIRDDQDIMRATARRIEQVVLGPATNHLCDMDFDKSAAETMADQQKRINLLEEDNARYKAIIDNFVSLTRKNN